MVTPVKSRPPHASFAMTGRRHRASPAAPSCSSFTGGSLLALCCLTVVFLAFSVSAAAEDCAEESDGADGDGRCLGFRDACADQSAFCFSSSVAQTLLASQDGIKGMDLEMSRDWGPSSPPLGFPMSGGGGVVSCSSVDTTLARGRSGLGPDGDAGVSYNVPFCQAPLVPDNWMRASTGAPMELDGTAADINPSALQSSLSMNVAISPPVLDWGTIDLYAASKATLTVVNLNNDSALRLYEPFSTDPQFYVYGYEDLELQPGDNATVTFVFLPKLLGSSSAHLVVQTNFGGFIIHAKGMAVSSTHQILPLTGIDVVIGGQLERNLSIYNPYDDALYVQEVAVWLLSSLETTRYSSHLVCQLGPSDGELELSSSSNNWYTASSEEFGCPAIYIRPSEQWEVLPAKMNAVIELKLQALSEGKVFGAICLKLRNCTPGTIHTYVIPIELEVHTRTYYDSSRLIAVTFEHLSTCDESGSIFSLSLRNDEPKLLRIVGITEDDRNVQMIFQIKYLNGLILFPDTVTDIALVRYTSSVPEDISFERCNIVVETNSTLGSSIIIPCKDLVRASRTSTAIIAESDGPFATPLYEEEISTNARTRTLGSMLQAEDLHNVKPTIMRAVKADDTILRQWRSHGTSDVISVLMDHEVMFPIVQIGSQFSKWIKVHNPSLERAAMQLVVNSEEIIDNCKTVTDVCELTFSSKSPEINSTETRFGFSLSGAAITEAHIGPSETALLGPIIFRPSNRCMWSSMALIRNNLSGVEMLPLRAYGGRQSIVLLEESKPAWKLEFNLASDVQNNSIMTKQEVPSSLCSQQLTKEIHVKNSGDLPLQVTKVKISGADCGVDGFTVDNCKGFSLAPSESIRMLISFQADFSSSMVQRDLELVMATGIFPIPMTANIPACVLNQCRKSFLRSAHWKLLVLFFGALTLLVLLFVRHAPHSLTAGSQDHYIKIDGGKSTIFENRKSTISKTLKPSFINQSSKKSRAIKENKRTEEAIAEKYSSSVIDSSKSTDDKNSPDKQLHTTMNVSASPANPVEDKALREAPQTSDNLTIRITREKGRRRKRKVGGAGLAGKFEVSSSHSGNSTPSSPLSQSSTPKHGWSFPGTPSELKHENKLETGFDVEATTSSAGSSRDKKTWSQVAKEQPRSRSASPGTTSPSAPALTTTAWRSPMLATCSSPIAPHVHAPGSNLVKNKAVQRGEGAKLKKDYTYDIWGDHFPANLLGIARNGAPCKMSAASEGAPYSLFAREPQTFMMKPSSAATPVSRGCGSPPSDVATGSGIK